MGHWNTFASPDLMKNEVQHPTTAWVRITSEAQEVITSVSQDNFHLTCQSTDSTIFSKCKTNNCVDVWMISICYGTNLPNTISSSEINIIVTISNCRQTLYSSCGGLISVTSHSMHCAKTDAFQSYMHIGKFLEQDSKAAISHYTECWCTRVHEAMHRVHRVCMEMQVHGHAHICISG